MSKLPVRREQLRHHMTAFITWLNENGAEVGSPTNPYEVIRYRAYWRESRRAVTHVVYAKENGLLTWTGGSQGHFRAFLEGSRMAGNKPRFVGQFDRPEPKPAVKQEPQGDDDSNLSPTARKRAALRKRDGDGCWFCGDAMGEDCTLEHLVPKSRGGGNDNANLVLAHRHCNNRVANLSVSEKVAIRMKMLAGKVSA